MKRFFFPIELAGLLFFFSLTGVSPAQPIAFPCAEGSGRFATGGRGGTVYEVTNLANSGPGSIVDAVSQPNRTIVFRLSGTIELGDEILSPESNVTIAGQTAPGDGICIKGRIAIYGVSDVVIRYIRVRTDKGGMNNDGDVIDIFWGYNIIIDHVSASYGRDETISCSEYTANVTVQWCIMSEALTFESHSYGSLVRGQYGQQKTYHHNLYAHNWGRNPRPGNYNSDPNVDPEGLYFDFRNNVVYNWLERAGYNDDYYAVSRYNFIGNVYIPGPESSGTPFRERAKYAYGYFADNSYYDWVPPDPWDMVYFDNMTPEQIAAYKARSYIIPMEPVTTTSPAQAKIDVLADAGASFPVRDIIDARIVNDVIHYTGHSIVDTNGQPEGAWPDLNSLPAPTDTDHDGMPNAWETAHSLNPSNAADRNYYDFHPTYTNLEVYLSDLIGADVNVPSEPNNLVATPGDATVALDWNDNTEPDLRGYYVYRSTTPGSGYTKLNASTLSSSNYTDNSVTNLVTYYYVVTAVDMSWNESDYSNQEEVTPADVIAPAAPAGFWATIADGNVLLDWNDNSEPDLDGYNIYRSTTPGSGYSLLDALPAGTSSYLDNTAVSLNTYYYVVKGFDIWSNESPQSVEVSATLSDTAMGMILREYWTGISGSSVGDLTSDPNYPDYPSGSDQLANLEGPTDWTDSYGTHIRGYLHPPTTGDYTFYIASDDNSELRLSSDGTPANASMIASVSGTTSPRQWNKYPSQQSSPISLAGGQKYYIEVLQKDNTAADNIAVAWSGPGITQQVIAGQYLSPWFIGLYGDITGDKRTDMNDLPLLLPLWLQDNCAATSACDLNGDCLIDFYEFSVFADNWLTDAVPPEPPTNLYGTPGDGTVALDWDDNSESDLDGYNVYHSATSGAGYVMLNGSLLNDSNYTDNDVNNGTTYYYVVTATDTSGNESDYSDESSATPNPPTEGIIIQENETGFCHVDGSIQYANPGYTGDGYADTTNALGAGVDWSINILAAGNYTFTFRYANGGSDRPARLLVNGSQQVPSISFPKGGWTTWTTVSVADLPLTAGIKDVRLEATGPNGLANIDYIEVTGTNVEAAACP